MISQRAVVGLIVGALGLPVALCVLYALVQLLEAMQDFAGADVVRRVNLRAVRAVGDQPGGFIDCVGNSFTRPTAIWS